ncbi:MAG: hypothetical protein F4X14_01555 [Caldilineaceae bacterium SB0661_bin_32]|uniref:SH3 domain-containing protein n=1 Tax=Caldilineaceae bacterium SB0661_bin_32 TaxID=2605255 RepID=A0A6B1D1I0_9CHLR|nr:hypothetical protein [Caldilineaceae bacterium SB0661_bin_32]
MSYKRLRKKRRRRRLSRRRNALIFLSLVSLVIVVIAYLGNRSRSAPAGPPAAPPIALDLREGDADKNIYAEPSFDAEVVSQMEGGLTWRPVGRHSTEAWWRIEYGGQTGWFYSEEFSERAGTADQVPIVRGPGAQVRVVHPGPELIAGYARAGTGYIDVYAGPDTSHPAVGIFDEGEVAIFIGRHAKAGWFLAIGEFNPGWISVSTPNLRLVLEGLPLVNESTAPAMIEAALNAPLPP